MSAGAFSSVSDVAFGETRECLDPDCDGTAESEQDGDHRFFECAKCGFEFGYERVEAQVLTSAADGSCSVGVPAEVRKAVSGITERALGSLERKAGGPVPLTIGKRPE